MKKELRLIDVNKKYKLSNRESFQALYDINVEFDRGELVSIVGESGSGKSTLMNLIGGLDSDFSGEIIVGEESLSKLTDKELDKYRKNKVGFVFQSFNLISHLSILDNVTLALTLSNVSDKEKIERATKMLKRVGLEHQLKKKPTQLSGGQKQRVAIARALINDPEIIIADEPTGALDSITSMQILEILKEIADSGKLVIMVTHSEKVAAISSRVVEIADGRIINDHVNENYKKTLAENKIEQKIPNEEIVENALAEQSIKKKKKQNFKDKQNLSMWSAIRLSFHNMWASRTKNFLMAFGVAIGIGSLILMMSFSSGITDYINNTMKSYSNPEIVTISKRSESLIDSLNYNPFTNEEIDFLYENINTYLESENVEFKLDDSTVTKGFNMFAMALNAKVSVDFEDNDQDIYYLYSIPPYYSEKNVVSGTMSTPATLDENGNVISGGGFMFSQAIAKMFPDEDPVGKTVTISFTITDPTTKLPTTFYFRDKICGIMDTSVMAGYMVTYIDYDYLKTLFDNTKENLFAPTTLYLNTGSKELTNKINNFISTSEQLKDKYTGSIEEQLAGMFNSMSSIIGTSLIVISGISLLVSAMMILVVLYMSVSERTKEIGVLKSIGARRKDIKRIFTSESFLIGVLSGFIGIIFNLVLTLIVWLTLTNLIGLAPISFRWWYFAVAMLVSIVISMLSGLYPASKAAKLDPVESLRRE